MWGRCASISALNEKELIENEEWKYGNSVWRFFLIKRMLWYFDDNELMWLSQSPGWVPFFKCYENSWLKSNTHLNRTKFLQFAYKFWLAHQIQFVVFGRSCRIDQYRICESISAFIEHSRVSFHSILFDWVWKACNTFPFIVNMLTVLKLCKNMLMCECRKDWFSECWFLLKAFGAQNYKCSLL